MLSLYIHWPYCVSKCPYCDFNSRIGNNIDQSLFRHAYRRELETYANRLPQQPIGTIYFGGGTPSLMAPETVSSVLNDISRLWPLAADIEITLEANPSSAEAEKFAAFRAAGINRLSLGIQSFNDDALKFLGRAHNAAEAKKAIDLAAKNFPRYSFDLIYGRASQTLDEWKTELRTALPLSNGHLSLYNLTIEPKTAFHAQSERGEILTAPEDLCAQMYEATQEIMAAANLPAYEISNHATKGQESRHNLTYWHYEEYLGIGPGAHSRLKLKESPNAQINALENHRAPDAWLRQIETEGHGQCANEALDAPTAMREALLMGLRLTEGIDIDRWTKKFPTPLLDFLPPDRLTRLEAENLILRTQKTLRATPAGLEKLNAILSYLL